MNLVIVESPAKAKTIEKYLGRDYRVLASFGHVRDLPEKTLGVDVKKNYEPEYEILSKAKKTIATLKDAVKKSDTVYLATDLDREGEAISWHLVAALNLSKKSGTKRIVFNEITKTAIEKAVKNPRDVDMKLVDAQQARRVLDRLVGYKLSPLLWRKVKKGLSAGRVQSVAVRLVVEKEREIKKFDPKEFWILGVKLSQNNAELVFPAYLSEIDGKSVNKYDIKTKSEAENINKIFPKANYDVLEVKHNDSLRNPSAPFTTSTLQMEASRKLGFSPKQTMMLAQNLYEAGHITYMRTDSVNLSNEAVAAIKDVVMKNYGQKYLDTKTYATKSKHAQEAHEAIRPTHFENQTVTEDRRAQKLYDLIWKRTVASQMAQAIVDILTVKIGIEAKKYIFVAKGEAIKFDGFIKVYTESLDDEQEIENPQIPELKAGEKLTYVGTISEQKFTEPPKRYTEATLVKKLESLGIGRPSTYAPTLDTIQKRGYVELREKKFWPSEIADIVTDLLVEHFPSVIDYQFTAEMEDELDDVADGKRVWQEVIDEFYKPFAKTLTIKNKELDKSEIMPIEKTGEKCPECGAELIIRHGRFGKFVACSGYPECKYSRPLGTKNELKNAEVVSDGKTESLTKAEGEKCEKCGAKMILKEGRFGKFLACENYPECKNTKTIVSKTGIKCPKCEEGSVIERRTKKGRRFWGCSRYPKCDYASWEEPTQNADEPELRIQN